MRAGELNRLVVIQRLSGGQDELGQPLDEWTDVGTIWANIANETGLGAIRSSVQGGVPASIARYSFKVRFVEARALAVDAGMRVSHDGQSFDIKGLTQDLKDREAAYILCEQGGNDG